jgi:hypothetical protein
MNSPQPYLTVASILSGFCISVFMFRIQRELGVRDRHPEWQNWLAWADYLIIAAFVLSLLLVVIPLVVDPEPSRFVFSIAAASCAAASLLLLAFPFAILDHYRIEIGTWRTARGENPQERHKGEPIERVIVLAAAVIATLVFISVVLWWNI